MRRRAYSKPATERSRHGTDFKMDAGAGQFVTWSSKLAIGQIDRISCEESKV
jgi:hypothetical protein